MSYRMDKKTISDVSTPLHVAVKNNDIEEVVDLLTKSADIDLKRIINASDVHGMTPLHVASANGFSIVVEILLCKGANVNAKEQYGKTPIHLAIERGHYSIVQGALKYHEDVNCLTNPSLIPLRTSGSIENKFIRKMRLNRGANVNAKHVDKHNKVVEVLLEYGADVNSVDRFGNTPLHSAAHHGNENICKFLLDKGADVNARRADGETSLYAAVEGGHEKLVEILLEYRADVDLTNKFRKTPLYISSHRVISKILLDKGADVDARERYGRTPLHRIVECNDEDSLELLEVLLEHRAKINSEDRYGNTPLHSSAHHGNDKISEFLLQNGANVNAKNQHGDTPLHVAVKGGHGKLAKILLEYGANVDSANNFNETPLYVSSHRVISKILLDKGANVDAKEIRGRTPLHAAVGGNNDDSLELLEVLIEYRANVNSTDETGNAALHSSAYHGNEKISKFLLKKGADVDAKNQSGETPLHVAVKRGREEIVAILLDYQADVDATDNSGWTPLHIAVSHHKTMIIVILLKNFGKVDAKDIYGTTPLHLAVECGYDETIGMLLEHGANIDDRVFQRTLNSNHERTATIAKIVQKNIVKFGALNVDVYKLYLKSIDFNTEIRDFCEDCEKEVDQMRHAINENTNVSFYDIVTKSVHRVATYASNEGILKTLQFKNYKSRFPIYSKMIDIQFKRGSRRAVLLNTVSEAFDSLFSYQLTNNVTKEILSYLTDRDLQNFIKACPNIENV